MSSSVLEPCALSSACLVSCWSMVFGSRHSCLEFRLRDGVRTLTLHVLSLCVSVRAFVLYLVLCGTQLEYSLAACFHGCHVLCEHVAYEFSH